MSTQKPVAVVAIRLPAEAMDRIRAVAEVREVPMPVDRAVLLNALAGADGLLTSNQVTISDDVYTAAPNLRVIANNGVGYNNIDVDVATAKGIAVCNTPRVLNTAVVETTFLLMLAGARRFMANEAYVRGGSWSRREAPPALGFDLTGKTLGIIGHGRIGQAVAARARAFGMKAVYYDIVRTIPGVPDVPLLPLPVLLRQSDVVTLHVNLTAESHHLIGEAELAQMKPSAWLINTSRGPVVDQAALAAALHKGTIAGAGLDVLEAEPPVADDPILTAPNTILLPHIGTATTETRAAMLELAVTNFVEVLAGRRPVECVNPEVFG